MRDGVEEYEMFRLLSGLDGCRERIGNVVNSIVFSPYGKATSGNLEAWNHNPGHWDEARTKIGNMIDEIETGR